MKKIAKLYTEKLGWSVIPVNGKIPAIRWKEFQERRPTPQEIDDWWSQWPKANLGVVTGKLSNIVVFDCDSQNGIDWMVKHGLPSTATVQSSEPYKRHFYFRYPENIDIPSFNGRLTRWEVDIDVKANGGYTVLPPSIHQSGAKYQWLTPLDKIADFEGWMFKFILNRQRPLKRKSNDSVPTGQYDGVKVNGASEGTRDELGFRVACSYLGSGMKEYELWPTMFEWNKKCQPPLKKSQLTKCVKQALRYHGGV